MPKKTAVPSAWRISAPAPLASLLLLFKGPTPLAATLFDSRTQSCQSGPLEPHAFGFRLGANGPEGEKRFPISY